jgi:hypothetical protein
MSKIHEHQEQQNEMSEVNVFLRIKDIFIILWEFGYGCPRELLTKYLEEYMFERKLKMGKLKRDGNNQY